MALPCHLYHTSELDSHHSCHKETPLEPLSLSATPKLRLYRIRSSRIIGRLQALLSPRMRIHPPRDTLSLRHYPHHSKTNSIRCLYAQLSSSIPTIINSNLRNTSNRWLPICPPNNTLRDRPLINNLCLQNLLLLKISLVIPSTSAYQQPPPRVQLLQSRQTLKKNISYISFLNPWSLKSIRR